MNDIAAQYASLPSSDCQRQSPEGVPSCTKATRGQHVPLLVYASLPASDCRVAATKTKLPQKPRTKNTPQEKQTTRPLTVPAFDN